MYLQAIIRIIDDPFVFFDRIIDRDFPFVDVGDLERSRIIDRASLTYE